MENVSEKLLSIDVGMKNLGFCLFQYDPNSNMKQKSYKILKWDVVNICEEKQILCCHQEKQKQCTKQAKYTKGGEYFCKKHATTYAIPSSQMDMRKIKKMKLTQLYDFADKHEIDYIKPMLKTKLLENIETHINNTYFQVVQPVRAADINLITLLVAGTEPGLQVQDLDGNWHNVGCDPGALVINSGDMLQEISGKYFPSTTHRVINPNNKIKNKSRYSMPLFLHPKDDVVLSIRYTARQYLDERLKEIGLKR